MPTPPPFPCGMLNNAPVALRPRHGTGLSPPPGPEGMWKKKIHPFARGPLLLFITGPCHTGSALGCAGGVFAGVPGPMPTLALRPLTLRGCGMTVVQDKVLLCPSNLLSGTPADPANPRRLGATRRGSAVNRRRCWLLPLLRRASNALVPTSGLCPGGTRETARANVSRIAGCVASH